MFLLVPAALDPQALQPAGRQKAAFSPPTEKAPPVLRLTGDRLLCIIWLAKLANLWNGDVSGEKCEHV